MEYIFSAIVSSITSNVLNRIFFRKRKTEIIIKTHEKRLKEKDKSIEKLKREAPYF